MSAERITGRWADVTGRCGAITSADAHAFDNTQGKEHHTMNIQEHLLTCLIEECGEIIQHTCKALRFGIDDKDPTLDNSPTERESIVRELKDLSGIVRMLQEHDVLPWAPILTDADAIDAKRSKVLSYTCYAKDKGALTE